MYKLANIFDIKLESKYNIFTAAKFRYAIPSCEKSLVYIHFFEKKIIHLFVEINKEELLLSNIL